ncbi:Pepco domain-containing protein [Actinophytocola sp.]|uniref:Pepco domain-containing protein n=1 Tax=Actinophytocola sp. TaxID=1872138 RepID=UPI003D6C65CF
MTTTPARRDDIAFISAKEALAPGQAADFGAVRDFFTRKREEVNQDWQRMADQLTEMVSGLTIAAGNLSVQEVEFQLGFSASGKLGFIAEAGVTGSVTVRFARADGDELVQQHE